MFFKHLNGEFQLTDEEVKMKPVKKLMVMGVVAAITISTIWVKQAHATFHLWQINEIFSNEDGTIQFVELFTSFDNQQFTSGLDIVASQDANINTFTFPANTPAPTGGHHLLLATSGFASLPEAPTPDFIIPDGFLFTPNGTVNFIGADSVSYNSLPTDGVLSLAGDGVTTSTNSPTNYAGDSGSVETPMGGPIPEPIEKGAIKVELELVADGLTSPVHLTHAGDGTNRLFVVDQPGQIRIIEDGVLLETPFLDVSDRLVELGFFGTFDENDFDERGLLGVAFHPDYANPGKPGHGKIYTYTSEPADTDADFTVPLPDGLLFDHQSIITEWTVDADPDIIDISTRREIVRIDQPQFNHDGGMLAFGPDNYLYISLGDGGAANDAAPGHGDIGNGQNIGNVLGTILRIDPIHPSDTSRPRRDKISANRQYRIPAGPPGNRNPFVRGRGHRQGVDEIYAFGFRNPWRFSFDTVTGELIVGDVGQNQIEEIDIVTKGGNYGWNLKEGSFKFDPNTGDVSDDLNDLPDELIDPVAEYDHDEGITVIGGYVYRGSAIPELVGRYVFGDFSSGFFVPDGRLLYADLTTGLIEEFILGFDDHDLSLYVKAFGQDQDGELYLLAGANLGPFGSNGQVLKIVNTD